MKPTSIWKRAFALSCAVFFVSCQTVPVGPLHGADNYHTGSANHGGSTRSTAIRAAWPKMIRSHKLAPNDLAYWHAALSQGNSEALDRLCWHYVEVGEEGNCDELTQNAAYSDMVEGFWRHGLELFRCGKSDSERMEGLFFVARALPLLKDKVVVQDIWVSLSTAFANGSFGIPKNLNMARYSLAHQEPPIQGDAVEQYLENIQNVPPLSGRMPYCSRP